MLRNERPTVKAIREGADILLYGEWVPLPQEAYTKRELREVIDDFLEVTTTLGALARSELARDTSPVLLSRDEVERLVKESTRMYLGILHYGLGVDIPDHIDKFLSTERDTDNGPNS